MKIIGFIIIIKTQYICTVTCYGFDYICLTIPITNTTTSHYIFILLTIIITPDYICTVTCYTCKIIIMSNFSPNTSIIQICFFVIIFKPDYILPVTYYTLKISTTIRICYIRPSTAITITLISVTSIIKSDYICTVTYYTFKIDSAYCYFNPTITTIQICFSVTFTSDYICTVTYYTFKIDSAYCYFNPTITTIQICFSVTFTPDYNSIIITSYIVNFFIKNCLKNVSRNFSVKNIIFESVINFVPTIIFNIYVVM